MVFKRETASNAIGGGARTYLPLTNGPSRIIPFSSFRYQRLGYGAQLIECLSEGGNKDKAG